MVRHRADRSLGAVTATSMERPAAGGGRGPPGLLTRSRHLGNTRCCIPSARRPDVRMGPDRPGSFRTQMGIFMGQLKEEAAAARYIPYPRAWDHLLKQSRALARPGNNWRFWGTV